MSAGEAGLLARALGVLSAGGCPRPQQRVPSGVGTKPAVLEMISGLSKANANLMASLVEEKTAMG